MKNYKTRFILLLSTCRCRTEHIHFPRAIMKFLGILPLTAGSVVAQSGKATTTVSNNTQ